MAQFERQTGRPPAPRPVAVHSFSGYTNTILELMTRLLAYLSECEAQLRTDVQVSPPTSRLRPPLPRAAACRLLSRAEGWVGGGACVSRRLLLGGQTCRWGCRASLGWLTPLPRTTLSPLQPRTVDIPPLPPQVRGSLLTRLADDQSTMAGLRDTVRRLEQAQAEAAEARRLQQATNEALATRLLQLEERLARGEEAARSQARATYGAPGSTTAPTGTTRSPGHGVAMASYPGSPASSTYARPVAPEERPGFDHQLRAADRAIRELRSTLSTVQSPQRTPAWPGQDAPAPAMVTPGSAEKAAQEASAVTGLSVDQLLGERRY